MAKTLPLDKMTTEEKIQVMELIWADLSANADSISPPGWHNEVLSDRERGLEQGVVEIVDWQTAKTRIKKDIS